MSTAVDNSIYRRLGHAWWDDDEGMFSTIRHFVNPVRFGYFSRVLAERFRSRFVQTTVLDVGCGGGFLAEKFAEAGCVVTGLDPAPETIAAAQAHATAGGLAINYVVGAGESLPFSTAAFDVVACCDVLEHVDNVDRVIGEIARVLRPGGLFFFDTINRTFLSRLFVIKTMQEWRSTAFAAPNAHVWDKFIRPDELAATLARYGLHAREFRGISPHADPISNWMNLRRRAQGRITFQELGRRMRFGESRGLQVSYMGWAVRNAAASGWLGAPDAAETKTLATATTNLPP